MLSTVTGNIKNITGVLSSQGTVVFSLANFGKSQVNLTETNSPIGLTNSAPLLSDGSFSIQVHSNDTIKPDGTLYLVIFITDCGIFGPLAYSITGSAVDLNTAVSSFPGVSLPATTTLFENASIQYVTRTGSDLSDGKSWATAKQTLFAAATALPGGGSNQAGSGVIYCSDGVNAHASAGVGLWIMGSADPNFSSPPTGWLKAPSGFLNIIGIPSQNAGPNAHLGRSSVNLGGNGVSKGTNPVFWFSSLGNITCRNLLAQNGNQGFRIGVDSNNAITNGPSGCTSLMFDNCSANSENNTLPAWTIGGESFWVELIDCGAQGNITTGSFTPSDDNAQAILIDGRGSSGGQIINFRGYTNLALGGIKFYQGTNGISQISIEDATEEGSFSNPSPVSPIFWVAAGGPGNQIRIGSALIADGGSTNMPAVRNDGTAQMIVRNAWGVGINVQGPMVSFADYGNQPGNLTVSPLRQGQVGAFNQWGQAAFYKTFGLRDDTRRNFIAASRFTNRAQTSPANWTATNGGVTLTTGQGAPDGSTNAATISNTNGFLAGAHLLNGGFNNLNFAVGDWLIIGGWVKSTSGNGPIQNPLSLDLTTTGFQTSNGLHGVEAGSFIKGDGEWQFVCNLNKVTAVGTNPCATSFEFLTDSTHTLALAYPVFLHIATGTISDNEAYELAQYIIPCRTDAPAGTISIPATLPFMSDSLLMPKISTAIVAPGTGLLTFRVEAGTNVGTLKLVAYAGTSTTGVTVADNIGAGN